MNLYKKPVISFLNMTIFKFRKKSYRRNIDIPIINVSANKNANNFPPLNSNGVGIGGS